MSATVISAVAASPATASPTSAAPRITVWPLYATLFSSVCIVVGLIWDISWHRTVGRDTFWTYPHVLEQLAAIIAGTSCGWLVLHTTFARTTAAAEVQSESVRVWGMRGPIGAWLCIWGTVMMITSAPFDNWWHNAYGLDVTIISPPHTILGLGMVGIELGAMLLALSTQNRADMDMSKRFGLIYIFAASVIVCMNATMIMELAGFPNLMHGTFFYILTACLFPLLLTAFARGSSLRWPATLTAASYMGIVLIMLWTLQLFPATPKLAPIYNPVTHMVPPPFPFLLIVPAFFMDLLMHRFGRDRDGIFAMTIGVVFVGSFAVVQWFLADFLLSPSAQNIVFGSGHWDYNIPPGDWQNAFWDTATPVALVRGLLIAAVCAVASSRLGLYVGNTMRRVKR
jgi:hypothetical protein